MESLLKIDIFLDPFIMLIVASKDEGFRMLRTHIPSMAILVGQGNLRYPIFHYC